MEVESLLARGSEALSRERHGEAFRDFLEASRRAPADPRPHHGMGQVYFETDRTELAERSVRRALELAPGFLPSRRMLARVLYDLGKTGESLEILKAIVEKEPSEPDHWWWVAKNELRSGNPAGALSWLRKYVEALPRNPWGLAYLGRALAEAGDREGAERSYRASLEVDGKIPLTWLWLGQVLVAAGRRSEADQALAAFRKYKDLEDEAFRCGRILNRRPDDFDTLLRLANIRILLGKSREALVVLERALKLRPDDEELRRLHEDLTRSLGSPAPKR
jgi:Flp pilus assembly protein TadD